MRLDPDMPNGTAVGAISPSQLPVDPVPHPGWNGGVSPSLVTAVKYSLKEAAQLAGVSESTMRNEVRNSEIPVIKIGTKIIIVQWDLEQYLQRRRGVEGGGKSVSYGCENLPDWVDNSPLLNPKGDASCAPRP